jgi:hypothetical protein
MQPLVQWKNKYFIFWVCVCSFRYPSCNAHAPCCHLWPVRIYNIFPHYLINGTIFERKVLITKCVLTSSTTFVWNISHSENNWARSDENVCWSASCEGTVCVLVCFMWTYCMYVGLLHVNVLYVCWSASCERTVCVLVCFMWRYCMYVGLLHVQPLTVPVRF